jgi:integrase/recombinase XerC/integrase/recombinase XerD
MGLKEDLKIGEYLYKYMKALVFTENLTSNSLSAYRSDLGQVLLGDPKIFIELQNLALQSIQVQKMSCKLKLDLVMSEENLVETITQGLRAWSCLAPASRNRKFSVIKGFLSFLYSEGCLSRDLSSQIVCPKVPRKIPHFLSIDEILSILSILKNKEYEHRSEKILFLLLYGGGLRISEACSLRWEQITKSFSELRIRGKGSKERIVVLPPLVQQALRKQSVLTLNDQFVFGESPITPQKGYYLIKKLGKAAGLGKSLNPHALRHSFATHLLMNGADIRILQQILGHESLVATEKYLHLNIDHLAKTVENLHPLSSSISARRT